MMFFSIGVSEVVVLDVLSHPGAEGHVPEGEEDGGVESHHVEGDRVHHHHLEGSEDERSVPERHHCRYHEVRHPLLQGLLHPAHPSSLRSRHRPNLRLFLNLRCGEHPHRRRGHHHLLGAVVGRRPNSQQQQPGQHH